MIPTYHPHYTGATLICQFKSSTMEIVRNFFQASSKVMDEELKSWYWYRTAYCMYVEGLLRQKKEPNKSIERKKQTLELKLIS